MLLDELLILQLKLAFLLFHLDSLRRGVTRVVLQRRAVVVLVLVNSYPGVAELGKVGVAVAIGVSAQGTVPGLLSTHNCLIVYINLFN